jgi:signal peptidase
MTTLLPRLAMRVLAVLEVVAVVVVVGLAGALLAGIVPSLLGNESFVVADPNMRPALQVGDLAIVGPTSAEALVAGDIVTFRTPQDPNTAVTRRILFREADATSGLLQLQTRGDSDPTTEQVSVAHGAVLGRLVYSVPRLGLLINFANGATGKLVLFGLPGLLLAAEWLRSRLRRRRPSVDDATRIAGLLDSGQRALSAGFPQLAVRAGDGVLVLDPHNQAAGLLKQQAIAAQEIEREHVAA